MSEPTPSTVTGAPAWIELFTTDADDAVPFYESLFGWHVMPGDPAFGGYRIILRDGQPVAGLMPNDGSYDQPNAWTIYLTTPDIQQTARKVVAAGGTVVMKPMQVGDLCWSAGFLDPAGAAIGAFQPLTHHGFAVRNQPGAPSWFETYSKDYEASLAFYRDAFDWDVHTMSDSGGFRYSTLGSGEDSLAGIMDGSGILPAGVPSHWMLYLQVDDTDKTVERAVAAGATVVQGPDDTPFGRIAALTDPNGAGFKIGQPPGR